MKKTNICYLKRVNNLAKKPVDKEIMTKTTNEKFFKLCDYLETKKFCQQE